MINVTDNIEAKKVDTLLLNEYNYTEDVLIQNAAHSLFNEIDKTVNKYIVAVGPGNNGADGLALAILLHSINKDVKIICKKNMSIYHKIALKIGIPSIEHVQSCDILIDAIFGFGFSGPIQGYYKELIDEINEKKEYKIISIDLNTAHINSDCVLMLSTYKQTLLNSSIPKKVLKIGVNEKIYECVSNKYIVDEEYIRSIKKEKNEFCNKSDFGRVKIYAKKGAALLASRASVKSGSGYTYLISDDETRKANLSFNPECINGDTTKYDVICLGPNNGVDFDYASIIYTNLDKKIVIDADALTYISNNLEILDSLTEDCVLTPHPLEFSRISGYDLSEILEKPFEKLEEFGKKYKGTIILKGKNNIIYDGHKFYIVNIGNSKMANAGMGDLLSGMIASYLAQGYMTRDAVIYATYQQAKIGRYLSEKKDTINPTDILSLINNK